MSGTKVGYMDAVPDYRIFMGLSVPDIALQKMSFHREIFIGK